MKTSLKVAHKIAEKLDDESALLTYLDTALDHYMRGIQPPSPKGKEPHVGIEIECYSPLKKKKVMALALAHDLENHIDIGNDGSINAPRRAPGDFDINERGELITRLNTYELRLLATEKQLPTMFKNLAAFLKEGNFGANDSCGLHVHLDMRNRSVEKCYKKLLKLQDVMFGMVKPKRWTNTEYTGWSDERYTKENRMTAINFTAYEDLSTIEIRLHEGTVDVKKMQNWVKLLLKVIGDKELPEVKSKAAAVKWAGKDKSLKSYIKKGFKSEWFKRKAKIIDTTRWDQDWDGDNTEWGEDVW